MSWEKLSPRPKCLDGLTVGITAASAKEKARCIIRVGRALAERSGLLSGADGKHRVDVFCGNGTDAGRMRIVGSAKGDYSAIPQGKLGAVKICARTPVGAPAEFEATETEFSLEDGITFVAPWHRRAADREVEELPPWKSDPPGLPRPSAILEAIRTLEEAKDEPPVSTSAPKTLDAVAETARDAYRETRRAIASKGDGDLLPRVLTEKPVDGTAKQHVYHDSERNSHTFLFTHKNKSCRMNSRQFAFAKRLYAAMQKVPGGILDNDTLMKAIETKELAVLTSTAIAVESLVAPLGLEIGVKRKTGYWMKEA